MKIEIQTAQNEINVKIDELLTPGITIPENVSIEEQNKMKQLVKNTLIQAVNDAELNIE